MNMVRKINLVSLLGKELSDKELSCITGGASGATCQATGCNALNANVMANKLLANLRGQNPPPNPNPTPTPPPQLV